MPDEKNDSSVYCEIYSALIQALPILPEHRASLKAKRGFSDETIDNLQFRSCAPSLEPAIVNLARTFPAKELRAAGVFLNDSPSPKLLTDNVLIPFIDHKTGKTVAIKPHKNAFSGFGLKPYLPAPLKNFAIIAESEFKAGAALQLGFTAVGTQGITSFSGKNLGLLCDTLKTYDVATVCICFDHEIKDNPAFPNYKRHFWDRWTTQYYSYLMALKLEQNGIEATIATLPDDWLQNGKVDIDGALAQGKTKEAFSQVIAKRKSPDEYLKTLPKDAQQLIHRLYLKSQTFFPIWIEGGRYMAMKGKDPVPTQISNFCLTIENNIYGADGECRREVTLTNDVGDKVSRATFEGDHFSHHLSFRKRCLSLGNFQFTGAQNDLLAIVGFESAREVGKQVHQPDHVGWIKEAGIYLFDNCGVSKTGERYEVDEDGVVWLGLTGYQAISLLQGSEDERGNIPRVWHQDIEPEALIGEIERNFGGDMGVRLACAWLCACFFSHELCKIYGSSFPLLFISGQQESGKSTLARWLCAMAGVITEGNSYWAGSLVGFQRLLGYYSSVPVWLDEYRNSTDRSIIAKEGFIRSAYDGQTSPKGLRADFGLRGGAVRGRLIISGQDTPNDQALQQRCVTIRLSGQNKSGQDYVALNGKTEKFSGIIPILVRRYHANRSQIIEAVHMVREHLRAAGLDDRTSITYGIVLGAYDGLIKANDKRFVDYTTAHAKDAFASKESEKPFRMFLEGIVDMRQRGKLNGNMVRATGDGLAIYMHGAVRQWREELRKSGDDFPFKPATLVTEFQEAGWVVQTKKSVRMNGNPITCVVLNPDKDEAVKALYDRAEAEEREKMH